MSKQTMVFIAIFIYVFVCSLFIEPNQLTVTNYEVSSPALKGIRIVFISDLQLRRLEYKKLDRIVSLANKQEPDIVLFGGDFLHGHDARKTMNPTILASKLNLIKAPMFAVLGENDWWTNGEALTSALRGNGIKVLENSNARVAVKKRFVDIVGLADVTTRSQNLPLAFYRTSMPRIVITHNPDVYYDIIEESSLILAGHTLGGQFIFPFTPPLFAASKFGAEFAYGMIKTKGNQMIITKGVGLGNIPIRFNCKPEIVVVDFKQ